MAQRFPFLRTKRGVAITVVVVLIIVGGGLAGLAALHHGSQADPPDPNMITSDAYFYGQSPPVYPPRKPSLSLDAPTLSLSPSLCLALSSFLSCVPYAKGGFVP